MKLKDNSTQEIDTALYQLEQRLKSNIRLTDVENSNASTAKINAVDKKLTEEIKDRQSADEKLQDNINKEIADRQEADAAIENAKQDKLIAGDNIQIDGNVISAISKEYTAEAPVKVTDGKISLDTVPVNKGGTGVTTQADINKAFVSNLNVGNDDVTDGTEFVSSWASDNGFADSNAINKPYKRQFIKVWNYIKGKISSVLGLTKDNYGGKAATATSVEDGNNVVQYKASSFNGYKIQDTQEKALYVEGRGSNTGDSGGIAITNDGVTAFGAGDTDGVFRVINEDNVSAGPVFKVMKDGQVYTTNTIHGSIDGKAATAENAGYAKRLKNFAAWQNQYVYDSTNGIRLNVYKITMVSYFNSILIQIYDDINYAICRRYVLGLWHQPNYGYNVSVTDLGGTKYNGLRVWLGNDGNVYLQADVYWTSRISFSYLDEMTDVTIEKIGTAKYGSNKDIDGNVLFTPLTDPITDSGAIRGAPNLSAASISGQLLKANITGNVTGNLTGNVTGLSSKSSFLDEYPGAGSTRLTSGNIKPKDASEYGGMRKDVVTSSMTDSGRPNKDGHLLTMFWDNNGRYDSQLFISNEKQPVLKARGKGSETDYGEWVDIITSNNIGSQTVATAKTARTAADAGFLCKLYQLDSATSDTTIQANNVILLGKIPDPASTEAPATPSASWDIDVDFYFVRAQGHKAAWCNVKAGYGYSNAWRKYGLIETFSVDSNSNYRNPFYLITVKYNNEYYIAVRHMIDIDGSYAARVKNVNTKGSRNPSTVNNTPLVNMLKVIPYQKTNGTVLNNEIKTSIADFPNTYAPAVERNGDLVLKSGYVKVGGSDVAGSKLTIHGATVNSNSYTDTNPKLEFKNNDESQNISLTFTDWDTVQAPASLTLNGNQGNEYFIAPNIKATTKFIGNLTGNVSGSSGSANKLTTARTAYVELGNANTNTTIDWSGDTTIPVNGVLGVANGGTGETSAEGAANSLISSLASSQNVPVDSDYFISQVVNGGPFIPAYQRRPISKLWEYIKGKISQEGEEFGYDHIVHDGASLLEWANCTDGSMKKVLIKSGTYNITKGVDLTKAGTSYVLAEQGAVINSHVPIAFTASSGKTAVHNLSVECDGASNGDNSCAFSANNPESLILYDCSATYRTYTEIVNRSLFVSCTCYNCSYAFQTLPASSSISVKVFYQCRCYNCKCSQTIAANSNLAISFNDTSYFYKECHCASCDAELTTLRNIKAATPSFSCYYSCWDRCIGCLSKINVNSKALTVYSTLYGFLRCQYMSSCKETHTVGYSNIKGIVQCDFISSTSGINGSSNTHVGNSCSIA